jgi:argininosuccinate lyase
MFPDPVYAEHVLAWNFRDFQRFFLDDLFDVLAAHALMLAETGLLGREDLARIARALAAVDREKLRQAPYDGSTEDVFFRVDRELEALAGAAAEKLRAARSRNDLDAALYRMQLRQRLLEAFRDALALAETLLDLAREHRETVYPANTHTQPAQPTTVAHLLLGVSEALLRDLDRFRAAFATVNRSPLGACAITTTGFAIDRRSTMQRLGFDDLQRNSYGAIAGIDYLAEACAAVAVCALTLGQFLQVLLDWSKAENGFLVSGEDWVQISSIMPQKRNPVAFEHARTLASRAFTEAQSVMGCLHNAPFEDTVDREDDLMPLAFLTFGDLRRALAVTRGALADARFDKERMRAMAGRRFVTATELADTLLREEGLSFKAAHELVAVAVRQAGSDDPAAVAASLLAAAPRLLGRPLRMSRQEIEAALDPWRFVLVRNVEGGPSPEAVNAQLDGQSAAARAAGSWLREKTAQLELARNRLHEELRSACA